MALIPRQSDPRTEHPSKGSGFAPTPSRPDEATARQRILLDEILATQRLKSGPQNRWVWVCWILYSPIGILLWASRLVLLVSYLLLGALALPRPLAGWLGAHVVFPLMGWQIRVDGLERLRQMLTEGTFFITVSNHVCYLDSVLFARLLRKTSTSQYALLASTLMGGKGQWELIKRLGIVHETVYTQSVASNAEQKRETRQSLHEISESRDRQNQSPLLLVFPEGQVHNCDRYLLRYERYCFGLGHPVLPIATALHCPLPLHLWVVRDHPLVTFTLMFFSPWVRWHYRILPAMQATEDEEAGTFANRVQRLTAETLGIQPTNFTLKDVAEVL